MKKESINFIDALPLKPGEKFEFDTPYEDNGRIVYRTDDGFFRWQDTNRSIDTHETVFFGVGHIIPVELKVLTAEEWIVSEYQVDLEGSELESNDFNSLDIINTYKAGHINGRREIVLEIRSYIYSIINSDKEIDSKEWMGLILNTLNQSHR